MQWAEDAVRKSISITETEALKDSVIDLVAPSLQALLTEIDGKTVLVNDNEVVLRTRDAEVIDEAMGWKYRILDFLSNPNVAYLLMLLGFYGLFFELQNPGSIFPGVVGVISLILAFYSLHTLPVNYAGIALILFGIILFLLEIKITSYGLLTVGGIISLLLGSLMLVNSESSLEFVAISWSVIIPAVLFTTVFFLFIVGLGIRAQTRKPVTGSEGLVGETGEAFTNIAEEGQVKIHGEIWNASTAGEPINAGTRVVVRDVRNLRLIVSKEG